MTVLTAEQHKRAEANRLAALAKRQAAESKSKGLLPAAPKAVPWQMPKGQEELQATESKNKGLLPAAPKAIPWQMLKGQEELQATESKNKGLLPAAPKAVPWQMPKGQEEPVPNNMPWSLFPCKKIIKKDICDQLIVVMEICSATEFSVTAKGATASARERLRTYLSSVHCIHSAESEDGGSKSIYSLKDYEIVEKALRRLTSIQLQQIPWTTLAVIRQFSNSSVNNEWHPALSIHASDDEVNKLLASLPKKLKKELLPFQMDGARFGLRRGGRCLIADEMGVGKTVQAIAIASCYMDEGPVLVVCPASMRCTWAEELERWLPSCCPADVHLVFGHRDNITDAVEGPKIVVISYTMLSRLRKSMVNLKWGLVIIDESHNLRCTKKMIECEETKAVLDVAKQIKRVVLLSGTPSLSRPYDIFHQIDMLWPGLLGKSKYDFARNYCSMENEGSNQKSYKDLSKGIRLQELNVLLRETVMIRRLKQNVLSQLPPKRRQVIRLRLNLSDNCLAKDSNAEDNKALEISCKCGFTTKGDCECEDYDNEVGGVEIVNSKRMQDRGTKKTDRSLSYQEIGLAKLQSFEDWLFNHPIFANAEDIDAVDNVTCPQKMVVFGHHLRVLDGIQKSVCKKGLEFVRIDGSTNCKERQEAVQAFRLRPEIKIAIIGITAGGVGLDFSTAQSIAFVELPKSASEMIQAEDRAHRRGQKNAVNIYVFCAKDTWDELHWCSLNKSLERTTTMMNGIDDCVPEIEVDVVHNLDTEDKPVCTANMLTQGNTLHGHLKGSELDFPNEKDIISGESKDNGASVFSFESLPHTKSDSMGNNHKIQNGEEDSQHASDLKKVDSELVAGDECDYVSDIPPEALLFEVSANTGRIHLYVCITNKDSRPRKLELNFRPEDFESSMTVDALGKSSLPKCLSTSSAHREIVLTFIKEWNGLRPIERNKLFGRPLRLPLGLELSCMKYDPNHGHGGLLKGGSKRRVASRDEISYPLPENATWRKISLAKHGKIKERHEMQAWTGDEQPLCKLCQNPCLGIQAKCPQYFDDLFCKISCFEEYRMRTSQQFLREELFNMEHGICTSCKLDCHKLVKRIQLLPVDQRREHILKAAPDFVKHQRLLNKLVLEPTEGNSWHADHIVPVYKGGGECKLENMRTLCVICHSKVTAEQQKDRVMTRERAKEGLQITIEQLIKSVCQKRMKSYSEVHHHEKVDDSSESEDEKELLIDVSGSAYSGKPIGIQSDSSQSNKIDDCEAEMGKKELRIKLLREAIFAR